MDGAEGGKEAAGQGHQRAEGDGGGKSGYIRGIHSGEQGAHAAAGEVGGGRTE